MTATRCSPTSTETRSSRFAFGSGGRRAGTRRRDCCWERWRFWGGLRSGFFSAVLGSSVLVAVSVAVAAGRQAYAGCDRRGIRVFVVVEWLVRPPRRASGLLQVVGWRGSLTGRPLGRSLRRNNFSKRKLLLWRARRRHPKGGARAAWVSGKTHKNFGSYGSSRWGRCSLVYRPLLASHEPCRWRRCRRGFNSY